MPSPDNNAMLSGRPTKDLLPERVFGGGGGALTGIISQRLVEDLKLGV